jgi:hypothetical protein
MTPRSLLVTVAEDALDEAARLAEEFQFDVVPIVAHGRIGSFWSCAARRIVPITGRHRAPHDESVERILPRLADHLVQFVFFRDEVVGLIDRSDLNRPVARLVVLRPLLECEQAILLAARARGISEESVADALGTKVAAEARRRRQRARREDLEVPLLEFVGFRDGLRAAVKLQLVALSEPDVDRLAEVRNRSAHGSLRLVEQADDLRELLWALGACRQTLRRA